MMGGRAVFVGSPRAGHPELFRWPQLIAVTDLTSAEEYRELRQRDPSFEPARRVMAAYSRQPFDVPTPPPVITDPATAHIAELAGLAYKLILHLLTRFFTHTDETREQLGVLVDSAIGVMAGVRCCTSGPRCWPSGAPRRSMPTALIRWRPSRDAHERSA
jgi:hypothetical protein